MATDNVLIISTAPGQPPNNFSTAHECTMGDAVIVTAPPSGCSLQFDCEVSVAPDSPSNPPQKNGIYSLAANSVTNFLIEISIPKDVHFYVGPPNVVTDQPDGVPAAALSSQAHTVRIGSSGADGF